MLAPRPEKAGPLAGGATGQSNWRRADRAAAADLGL